VSGWQALIDEEILDVKYNRAWGSADGIALVTGEKSGVICLDIDILDSNERLAGVRKELLALMPPTFSGRRGSKQKPFSVFYQYDGAIDERTVFSNIDVEILSGGHACVLPQSMHTNGYEYEQVGESLLDIDPDNLPIIPVEVLEFLTEMNEKFKPEKVNKNKTELSKGIGRCNHGSHDVISKLGVALIHKNYPFDKLVERLLKKDKEINHNATIKYFDCPSRKWKKKKSQRQRHGIC
jgi:hypothetical protein